MHHVEGFDARYQYVGASAERQDGLLSCDDRVDHFAVHVSQTMITSAIGVREALVVKAEEMQHCRVQVMHVDWVLYRNESEIIRGAMDRPNPGTAACHPHREAVVVMITPRKRGELRDRCATELAAPDDERRIQESPCLEIREEASDRLIPSLASFLDLRVDAVVVILQLFVVPHLDESHAPVPRDGEQ